MSTVDENIEVTVKLKKDKIVPAKVGTILTEVEYDTLNKMLHSKDPGDHTMAQQLLNQCDIQQSIYWIWKLGQRNANRMVYLRTKASRAFAEESCLFEISWMSGTRFAISLINKGWMTSEIYLRLKEVILEDLRHKNEKNTLYDIHVIIRPEIKHFDLDDTLTPLNIKHDKL